MKKEFECVKPTHFAVLLPISHDSHYPFYVFVNSREKLLKLSEVFQRENPQASLIALKKIHSSLLKDVQDYAKNNPKRNHWGSVEYQLFDEQGKKIAVSTWYCPKPEKKAMKGMGYYLEALCLNHLKKLGVTHVKTSHSPSDDRAEQLRKVGLPTDQPVEIDKWLKALGKGIKSQLKNK